VIDPAQAANIAHDLRSTLRYIREMDPDNRTDPPTDLDYTIFEAWVTSTYGEQVWLTYSTTNWDEPGPRAEPDRPMHGARLVMALPMWRALHNEPDHFVVMVNAPWSASQPWVTATVKELDDTTWCNGHYFADRDAAVVDAYLRASTHLMPWAEIAEKAKRRVDMP